MIGRKTLGVHCLAAIALCGMAVAACSQGDDGGRAGGGASGAAGGTHGTGAAGGGRGGTQMAISRSPLLRLTQAQYYRAASELLGVETTDIAIPPDGRSGLFSSNAGLSLTLLGLDQYAVAAETLAKRAVDKLPELAGCEPKIAAEERDCVMRLISKLVPRAYRRAPTPSDSEALVGVFTTARQDLDYKGSVGLMLEAMLQAPAFLYRVERGVAKENGHPRLTSFEMAMRLSLLLRDSLPDEALMQAAQADALQTDDQLKAQVERLWQSPQSSGPLSRFHREWLGLSKLETLTKNPKRYPFFNEAVRVAMRNEVDAFVDFVLHKSDRRLKTLLSAPLGFPSGELFRVYGLTAPADAKVQAVGLPATQRAGLLTLPAVMATHATGDLTSPVHRGLFVLRSLLCQDLPPPPEGVDVTPIAVDPEGEKTRRELFAEHQSATSCGSCHKVFDPLGFAFEHYDAVGAYRTMDADERRPVDATANIATGLDVDGQVTDALTFIQRISSSRDVHDCYVQQWWTFAMGRAAVESDAPAIAALADRFAENAGDVLSLVTSIVLSEDFRTRQGGSL